MTTDDNQCKNYCWPIVMKYFFKCKYTNPNIYKQRLMTYRIHLCMTLNSWNIKFIGRYFKNTQIIVKNSYIQNVWSERILPSKSNFKSERKLNPTTVADYKILAFHLIMYRSFIALALGKESAIHRICFYCSTS